MKKSSMLIMILVMTMIIAGCKKETATTEEPIVDATQHDNYFDIWPQQFSPAMSYSFSGNYKITSGQPWSGVSSAGSHGGLELLVKAGRKGSYDNANWFDSNVSNATCTADNLAPLPDGLNFALTGTLTINGNSYPVTIGQGHYGAFNNWWIGGPGWVFPNKSTCGIGKICTPDRKYLFTKDDTSAQLFWVSEN